MTAEAAAAAAEGSKGLQALLLRVVSGAQCADLPAIVGALAQAHAHALARLVNPAERQEDDGEDRLLTMPEVSERLGITEHQARELGRRGELPTIIVGERHVRVRRLALLEWIRRREAGRMIRHGRT